MVRLQYKLLFVIGVLVCSDASFGDTQGKIAFQGLQDFVWDIFTMNADGTDLRNLTNSPLTESYPVWSPGGKRIAYVARDLSKSIGSDVFVMDDEGKDVQNLTDDPLNNLNAITGEQANDTQPTWSPDGTRLAFASDRDGYYNIWIMNSDGTGAENITRSEDFGVCPTKSTLNSANPGVGDGRSSLGI